MSRFQKILLLGFLLLLAAMVYMEASKPQPVNWFPSYLKSDKIPLGTNVLYQLMKDFFKEELEEVDLPPFEFIKQEAKSGSYFFVNNEVAFDDTELDSLLDWTSKGNTLFVSANFFGKNLLDTLNLKMNTAVLITQLETEPLVKLVNEKIPNSKTFHIEKDSHVRYFSEIDTLRHTVMGISDVYSETKEIDDPKVNFIRVPMEKGTVYLHSQPEVFSNFFLLGEGNADYVAALLSYVNTGETILWDNYYKSGKPIDVSPLRILMANKYFKWAYYFVLIGVLLFVIFEGKRKQRSIPIVKPLANKSYEYAQTIAGLYMDKKAYHAIAQKQIALFLEYIRTKLRVPTENQDKRFYAMVSERSGNTLEKTIELFALIDKTMKQDKTTKTELMALYKEIDRFKEGG